MDWGNITLGGVAIMPVWVAFIEFLKKQGMPVEYAPWVCGGGALISFVLSAILIPMYPELATYAGWVVGALVTFLSATAGYQVVKPTSVKKN